MTNADLEAIFANLNERIATLEAIAPRCGCPGCGRISNYLCLEHAVEYEDFRADWFEKNPDKAVMNLVEQLVWMTWQQQKRDEIKERARG